MNITSIKPNEISEEILEIKPELLDMFCNYLGAFIDGKLVGIVGWQEHPHYFYVCHDFVLPEYRGRGVYDSLFDIRMSMIKGQGKDVVAHANFNSLNRFVKGGFNTEYELVKVIFKNN